MKKVFKRIGALLIAMVMVIAMCVPVMATTNAGPVTTDDPTTTDLANKDTLNYPTASDTATITVNGFVDDQVDANNVYAYRIVKAQYDQKGQVGFSGYIAMVDVFADTEEPIEPVTPLFDSEDKPIYPNSTQVAALAENTDILGQADSGTDIGKFQMTKGAVDADGKVAFTATVPVGEYLVLAKSKDQETVYNPMVVSVYYTVDDEGNEVIATKAISADEWWGLEVIDAYVKTSTPTVEKTVVDNSRENPAQDSGSHGDDHAIGDTVDFKITSMIPSYSAMFENTDGVTTTVKPIVYNITDTMEEGLTYLNGAVDIDGDGTTDGPYAIVIKVGEGDAKEIYTINDGSASATVNRADKTQEEIDVMFSADVPAFTYTKNDHGYKLVFNQSYILDHDNYPVEITYSALVNDSAATVNYDPNDNKVDVEYTIDHTYTEGTDGEGNTVPGNTTHQEDTTYHYTFEIDGDVLGGTEKTDDDGNPDTPDQTSNRTHELIKLDENGNTAINQAEADDDSGSTITKHVSNPLAGAIFELTRTDPAKGDPAEVYYSISDGDGLFGPAADGTKYKDANNNEHEIKGFKGLDAGTYTLKEVKAPEGYTLNKATYTITISAEYYSEDAEDGTYKKGMLKSYTIAVKNDSTQETATTTHVATYTLTEETDDQGTADTADDVTTQVLTTAVSDMVDGVAAQASTLIKNTKLNALPSTGGMGSYLFTIIGVAVMAVVAGSFFRSRAKRA